MSKKYAFLFLAALLAAITGWLLVSESVWVWPVRNTLQYQLLTRLYGPITEPLPGPTGALTGQIFDAARRPIAGARVLVPHRSGVTYSARTDAAGQYTIEGIPPGRYRPVAGAPGFESVQFGRLAGDVVISAGEELRVDAVLPPKAARNIAPGTDLALSNPAAVSCSSPLDSQALRYDISFNNNGQPGQPAFFYTPISATTGSDLPLLLAIYPGPADSWECASLPLAAAGYAVLATGPAYSFNLEADLDELERLLRFAAEGRFPATRAGQVGMLGGSYSSLHVQRLLQRGVENSKAALILGPPTDLFEMRRQLESGGYIPPFGLDQAFVALGLPDRVPLRYWEYSGAYQVGPNFPPLAIFHSRNDEIVPYQQSELLAKNLDDVGAPYELHIFNGATHYLMDEGGGAEEIFTLALDFLARRFE
ncbi:MAG: hypothetical protein Kow0031_07480 [Anaerolineae bacterium]